MDRAKFVQLLHQRGYRSIQALAGALGVHRNTISHYLSGAPIFPRSFAALARQLGVTPTELITEEPEPEFDLTAQVAELIDTLHDEFPQLSFVLLGSRARRKAQPYSDWDIGFFANESVPHAVRRKLHRRVSDLSEDLPFFVDVVDLNRADRDFLRTAARDWKFLTGSRRNWHSLQERTFYDDQQKT